MQWCDFGGMMLETLWLADMVEVGPCAHILLMCALRMRASFVYVQVMHEDILLSLKGKNEF